MSSDLAEEIENAIDSGNAKIVERLLENAPANLKGTLGRTPLHYAAEKGRDKIVALLVDRKANLNAREFQEATPLQLAASKAHASVCRILLDAGAATDLANTMGDLPIHSAAREMDQLKTRTVIAGDLIAAGSPLTQLNNAAQSPLQVAAMMGNRELVQILLEALTDAGRIDNDDLVLAAGEAEAYNNTAIAKLIRAKL